MRNNAEGPGAYELHTLPDTSGQPQIKGLQNSVAATRRNKMKTKIDYTEEKVALARELGLVDCAETMAQIKKEIDELTNLKFKPISYNTISKMISKRVFRPFYHEDSRTGCIICASIGYGSSFLIFLIGLSCSDPKNAFNILNWGTALTSIPVIGCFIAASFPKCDRQEKALTSWKDPLPRGALLAVKEATVAGLSNFQIHYPVLESRRVLADPVIVGYRKDIKSPLLIHAWDDGKVHD